jgi:putative FmdB family regulatory protein
MPEYDFVCTKCEKKWTDFLSISNRDTPIKNPCPFCSEKECVEKSWSDSKVSIASDVTLTANKATGGRWNELMAKMKSGLPERYRKKLDTPNNMTGRRWKG